jgi:hypothetical protein
VERHRQRVGRSSFTFMVVRDNFIIDLKNSKRTDDVIRFPSMGCSQLRSRQDCSLIELCIPSYRRGSSLQTECFRLLVRQRARARGSREGRARRQPRILGPETRSRVGRGTYPSLWWKSEQRHCWRVQCWISQHFPTARS